MEGSIIVTMLMGFAAMISIAVWAFTSFAHMKAFKMMGYQNAWGAWIPFYSSYILADCIPETKGDVDLWGFKVPGNVFKFWWLIVYAVAFIPLIGTILSMAGSIICAGYCYTSIFSILENKSKEDVQAFGYLSGWINLIAAFKFLTY